jgi:enoyl-CoA hydratase/carnithine racemase
VDFKEWRNRSYDGFQLEFIDDRIVIIYYNNPPVNAGARGMLTSLEKIYTGIGNDEDIRCSIITGNDTPYKDKHYFSAGADVKAWSSRDRGKAERTMPIRPMINPPLPNRGEVCFNNGKPTIAMVNGTAVGAGADHIIACDIAIAADNARIGWSYIQRGGIPYDGGTWLLPRRIGLSNAFELLTTGKIISAEEAYRLGIFTKIVPHSLLRETTLELAQWYAKGPPLAIGATRALIYQGLSQTYKEHMETLRFAAGCVGVDRKEGMASWAEKREPQWEGKGITSS